MSNSEPPPPPDGSAPYGTPPYGSPSGGYGGYGYGGYEPPGPPGYGPPGYGYQPPQQSGMAIAALVSGILSLVGVCCCGLLGLVGIAGVVCGLMAKKEIQESRGAKTGDGLALAGIITGAIGIVLGVASIALIFVWGGIGFLSDVDTY